MLDMDSVLADFTKAADAAVAAARTLLPHATDHRRLRSSLLAVHTAAEQLRVVEAELLAAAEEREAWVGTGAKNMADWLARTTKSSYGPAKRRTNLGSALSKNKKLKEALDNGDVSPDAAEQLADTINQPPKGAEPRHLDDLVDACKGASPDRAHATRRTCSTPRSRPRPRKKRPNAATRPGRCRSGPSTTAWSPCAACCRPPAPTR